MKNSNSNWKTTIFSEKRINKVKSESMRNYLRSLNRILESNNK